MDCAEKIVDYLNRNRVSTTEVADVLGKTGALKEVMPINRGQYRAGVVKWVYAYDQSNWSLHKQISDIEEDKIIVISTFKCEDRAVFGELVSKYLLLYRQSRALVVQGKLRDAAALIREKWPIWCTGFTPEGCFNSKPNSNSREFHNWLTNMKEKYDGAVAVCDDCGVVIIPKIKLTNELLDKLVAIENQEDIWFDRLDHYKENTFDIVCEKKYLSDLNYMNGRK